MDIGYGLIPGFLQHDEVEAIKGRLPDLDGQAGSRGLLEFEWCATLAVDPRLKGLADTLVNAEARPVRGILFDKVAGRNWIWGGIRIRRLQFGRLSQRCLGFRLGA